MSEPAVSTEPCPDCQVEAGIPHGSGCDVARCLMFGEQRLMHESIGSRPKVVEVEGAFMPVFDEDGVHDCGQDVWSGEWPGVAECREFGWYSYFVPNGDPSWVSCGADHPRAHPDLNRLYVEARWDASAVRWVLP